MLPTRYRPLNHAPMAGGYGSVQVVQDTYLDRCVIFKSMQNPVNNQQLENEIRHLSSARSRHVVEVYDVIFGNDGTVQGIVIENLTGRDFLDFHLEAAKDLKAYVRVLYQISTALADLHRLGVTHRDLKLDNFKESSSGVVKLFDFGLSVADDNYHTKQNRGTLVYAAPELFTPYAHITPAMDVYAFGVCAWALASPSFPNELLQRPPQSSGPVPSIKSVLPKLPAEIVHTIDSCLSTNPALRPDAQHSASVFARHLVRGQHRGLFVVGQRAIYELSKEKNNVTVTVPQLGVLKVSYDGLDFFVTGFEGAIRVNNLPISVGLKLPEACVLTFGAPNLGSGREWVTFTSSKPEVVL